MVDLTELLSYEVLGGQGGRPEKGSQRGGTARGAGRLLARKAILVVTRSRPPHLC